MTLEVLGTGPMLSVQDRGRHGRKRFGVPVAGAMDGPAMELANALCGNPAEAAALEFTGIGGSFRAGRALRFAVTGGDCAIHVGERLVPAGESHNVEAGEVVKIGALRGATWGYIAVAGGIAVPEVLGARATHLRFELVTRDAAEEILLAERKRRAELLAGLVPATGGRLSSAFLLSCNLAGGIVAPEAVMGRDLDQSEGRGA